MILTVAFGKGGTGKTTTVQCLYHAARRQGFKCLAIDTDPQANLTAAFGASTNASGCYEVITGKADAADVIQATLSRQDCECHKPKTNLPPFLEATLH